MGTTECICAIDQGTQSTRVYLFDKQATVIGKCQQEFTQFSPATGYDVVLVVFVCIASLSGCILSLYDWYH